MVFTRQSVTSGGQPHEFRRQSRAISRRPARQLMVALDPETGELRPVIQRSQPTYIYLCREERELP
jgi:hypothetical protein